MSGQSLVDELKSKFGGKITGATLDVLDPWIEVAPDAIAEVCQYLKDHDELRFDMINCITGVDYYLEDPKKLQKAGWEPHLEVVYHLSSTVKKHTLVLKVILPRWKEDQPGKLPEVRSVTGVWRGADWHEREVYDLSGIRFVGHPELRRILCPEDWVGYPLRRDYEMPLEYHGMRGR